MPHKGCLQPLSLGANISQTYYGQDVQEPIENADSQDAGQDWSKAPKKKLLEENERLRKTVARLMQNQKRTVTTTFPFHPDDFVPIGWPERYGIAIPRADGLFESAEAWVRVTHGVITGAGLKNQSILSVMILGRLLSTSAELYAKTYTDWRAAFFARIEAARYCDEGCGDPEAWSKEDRYSKLVHRVERKYLRYVDAIVHSRPTEKHIHSLNGDPTPWVQGFERMANAVHQINREADAYLEQLHHGTAAIAEPEKRLAHNITS